MGKQAEVKSDSPEVVAWAVAKGIRVGSDGHVDAGHLEAYVAEKQREADLAAG